MCSAQEKARPKISHLCDWLASKCNESEGCLSSSPVIVLNELLQSFPAAGGQRVAVQEDLCA